MAAIYEQVAWPDSIDGESLHADESDLTNGSMKPSPDGKRAVDLGRTMRNRQRILELICENSGESLSGIEDGVSLEEIGIDSLSVVELKEALEDTFGKQFAEDRLHLQSTVKEILD